MVEKLSGKTCGSQQTITCFGMQTLRGGQWWRRRRKKSLIVRCILFTTLCGIGFCTEDSLGGSIYKWVDKNGVTHYSDRKPGDSKSVDGSIEERKVEENLQSSGMKQGLSKKSARSPVEFAANATFTIAVSDSEAVGAGFFISPDGYAITCKHVVNKGGNYVALLNDRKQYPISVVSESQTLDLALILILDYGRQFNLSLRDSDSLVPGDRLFAIGAPLGLQATVTDGVFTGFRVDENTGERAIQFSAPINPGNSGGPLIDESGQVVGVVSWKYARKGRVALSGLGFAIPSNYVNQAFEEYMK